LRYPRRINQITVNSGTPMAAIAGFTDHTAAEQTVSIT
jgi:hypothetical protein